MKNPLTAGGETTVPVNGGEPGCAMRHVSPSIVMPKVQSSFFDAAIVAIVSRPT